MTPGLTGTGKRREGDERQLCAAILHQALLDYWFVRDEHWPTEIHRETLRLEGYEQDREGALDELADFFESDWLDYLCLALDIPLEAYLNAARNGVATWRIR